VILGVAASVAAGDVWINCAPGFDIFLDGESMGVSERDESGKHLRGIESGAHTVRIEKDGVALAEFSVNVGFDPYQVELSGLSAEMNEEPPGTSQDEVEQQFVGSVEITSDPRECNVKIGSRRILKKLTILMIPDVPIGEHKIWFESSGTVLSEKVVVRAAQLVRVRLDFRNKQVAIGGDDSDVEGGDSVAETPTPRAEPACIEYWIEVLRTDDPEAIEAARSALKEQGFPLYHQKLIAVEQDGTLPVYKLRVGPVTRNNMAKHTAGLLRHGGFKSAWVVPEECQ
jgi:hypothetical protein